MCLTLSYPTWILFTFAGTPQGQEASLDLLICVHHSLVVVMSNAHEAEREGNKGKRGCIGTV